MTKVFISYSWDNSEHKRWVRNFSTRLKNSGIDVTLDQWHLVPGDQIPEFMERAVRESDYVLIICTQKYKKRSDSRQGGVGYEGDIMTAEVISSRNQRRFIPILRDSSWKAAAPSWLLGKYYIDLSSIPYSKDEYRKLLKTLRGKTEAITPDPTDPTSIFESEIYATKPSDKRNRWIVVTSEGTDYSEQQIITTKRFSDQFFQGKLTEGYWLTNLNYASGNWVIAFSKGGSFSAQTCHIGKNFPRESIKRDIGKGFRITNLSYGLGKWVVVLSKGSELSNQLFNVRPSFPSAWIHKNYRYGYRVTSLAYGGGKWAITLSKGSRILSHKWWLGSTLPVKFIRENSGENYRITSLVYGDGEWATILSEGSNYSRQSLRFIDLPKEGEIKSQWSANNYVTNIEFGPP